MAAHRPGQCGKAGEGVGVVDAHEEGVVRAGIAVDNAVAQTDGGRSAKGFPFEEGGTCRVGETFRAYVVESLWRVEDTVAKERAADLQRLEQVWVPGIHGCSFLSV